VKYKKSLILIQEKSYEPALSLLKQVTNPEMQSEVGYYMGVIYTILNDFEEATLAFTKAIQFNTSEKFVGQSFYEKFVIMFKKNDFYGIQHEFDMIGDRFAENEAMEVMRKVIEGSIFILKMNFLEGIAVFNSVTERPCYLRNMKIYASTVSSFKIFAFYSLHDFEKALNEFANIKSKKGLESNKYNLTMLKAMKSADSGNYNEDLELFKEAESIEPFNTHTFMVKAIVEIMFYNHLKSSNRPSPKPKLSITNQ
jgi:tetratricopeptide (TPR) repeat protein